MARQGEEETESRCAVALLPAQGTANESTYCCGWMTLCHSVQYESVVNAQQEENRKELLTNRSRWDGVWQRRKSETGYFFVFFIKNSLRRVGDTQTNCRTPLCHESISLNLFLLLFLPHYDILTISLYYRALNHTYACTYRYLHNFLSPYVSFSLQRDG